MFKQDILAQIQQSYREWLAVLAGVPLAEMSRPGPEQWSAKDMVAHITWFERQMVGILQAKALIGSPLWERPAAERNEAIYLENRERDLADVLAEAEAIHQQLVSEIEQADEDDLTLPGRIARMPADWLLWQLLAENSFDHYPDHRQMLATWLAHSPFQR